MIDIAEDLWKVYVHTNKINGKRYVGVTSRLKPEYRWNSGRGYRENTHFWSAIEKYGWDSFEHTILYAGLSEDEAKVIEKKLIAEWHTQDNAFGYNMTSGGDGTPNYSPSPETRAKLSEARRKENLSEETLKRRSAALKGRKFSDEHKRKIGLGNSKPVQMLDKQGAILRTFGSALEAEETMSINHSHISQCCYGTRLTTGGYRWQFVQ